jgi:diphosphomevalonate decarboxylase
MKQPENGKRSGLVFWESPANIALVKYWGKLQGQIPMNPSLSFTLRESVVRIAMSYQKVDKGKGGLQAFRLNGQANEKFQARIGKYIESMKAHYAFLADTALEIDSQSTFPHSAGIASSAAAFSALAMALGSIENDLEGRTGMGSDFLKKASFAARLGSGSACRSVYGGYTVWGKSEHLPGSSDEFAVKLQQNDIHPVFQNLHDAVLIVDDTEKKVSSTAGHALMNGHDFRESRIAQAEKNLGIMIKALKTGDEELFVDIVENEALTLHGLMMSSRPGYILIKPGTIALIEKIRDFRLQQKINLCFTLDAGPNIHLIYPDKEAKKVRMFISQELLPLCKNRQWMDDGVGEGPKRKPIH